MKSIWKYHALLPRVLPKHRLLLGEGQTPLVKSKSIGKELGLKELYFKLENLNPTGSYKDRFAALFTGYMRSSQQKKIVATSSGNTGAALAAYSAAGGLHCILAIVDGAPVPKLKQMQLYGASLYMIKGFGKDTVITNDVFAGLEKYALERQLPLPVSAYRYCPIGMQGVETIAFELLDELRKTIRHIFSPAGGGGLTLALIKGVLKYNDAYRLPILPAVHCVQPEGNNTIAGAIRKHESAARAIKKSMTEVSGLQVPGILDGHEVVRHAAKLKGNGYTVSDEEVFGWQKKLAQEEGIFSEPAGAVSLAGLSAAVQKGEVAADDSVVCLITGSGFKDFAAVDDRFSLPAITSISTMQGFNEMLTTQ